MDLHRQLCDSLGHNLTLVESAVPLVPQVLELLVQLKRLLLEVVHHVFLGDNVLVCLDAAL